MDRRAVAAFLVSTIAVLVASMSAVALASHEGREDIEPLGATVPETTSQPPDDPGPAACTIVGTNDSDTLIGTPRRDVICGLGRGDVIVGREGADELRGGTGDDVFDARDGVRGNDVVEGGRGQDSCSADRRDEVSSCQAAAGGS